MACMRPVLLVSFVLHWLLIHEAAAAVTSWRHPAGCDAGSCQYRAEWQLDEETDLISFTINARQPASQWTGIAFAPLQAMENMDAYIAFIDATTLTPRFVDGWTTTRYTKPVADQSQDVANATLDYDSGVLTFTFQRARNTGDSRDWTFSNSSDDCYYFIFPVGGGPQTSDGDFGAHSSTPKISQRKYCIAGSKPFHLAHVEFRSTFVTVERGRPVVAGTALIARFTSNSEADALMFTEDPQTQNIVTVDGKLCVTDDDNGLKLAACETGGSYYRLRYLTDIGGSVLGVVRGTDRASMAIAAYSSLTAIMEHRDDPLIGLPYASNEDKLSTQFVPRY